jgi:hypothetical protein
MPRLLKILVARSSIGTPATKLAEFCQQSNVFRLLLRDEAFIEALNRD